MLSHVELQRQFTWIVQSPLCFIVVTNASSSSSHPVISPPFPWLLSSKCLSFLPPSSVSLPSVVLLIQRMHLYAFLLSFWYQRVKIRIFLSFFFLFSILQNALFEKEAPHLFFCYKRKMGHLQSSTLVLTNQYCTNSHLFSLSINSHFLPFFYFIFIISVFTVPFATSVYLPLGDICHL